MNNKYVNFEGTIVSASGLLEMSPMQPKRSDMNHIQPGKVLLYPAISKLFFYNIVF